MEGGDGGERDPFRMLYVTEQEREAGNLPGGSIRVVGQNAYIRGVKETQRGPASHGTVILKGHVFVTAGGKLKHTEESQSRFGKKRHGIIKHEAGKEGDLKRRDRQG